VTRTGSSTYLGSAAAVTTTVATRAGVAASLLVATDAVLAAAVGVSACLELMGKMCRANSRADPSHCRTNASEMIILVALGWLGALTPPRACGPPVHLVSACDTRSGRERVPVGGSAF
jgi:hypothetical protein